MIIKAAHLKAARRHAQRVGKQLGDLLDSECYDGDLVETHLQAWQAFIDQFGDPATGDVVARTYVADGFLLGVAGRSSALDHMILS